MGGRFNKKNKQGVTPKIDGRKGGGSCFGARGWYAGGEKDEGTVRQANGFYSIGGKETQSGQRRSSAAMGRI